jgi:hypothetical protein
MDSGKAIEIASGPAERSLFADFGLAREPASVYVRVARSDSAASVLRNTVARAEPVKYARALLHRAGGMLIAGAERESINALHLLLPTT